MSSIYIMWRLPTGTMEPEESYNTIRGHVKQQSNWGSSADRIQPVYNWYINMPLQMKYSLNSQ